MTTPVIHPKTVHKTSKGAVISHPQKPRRPNTIDMVMVLLLILLVLNLLIALAMAVATASTTTPDSDLYLGLLLSLILVIAIPFAVRGVWRGTWWAKTLTTVSGGIAVNVGVLNAWQFLQGASCGIVIAVAGLLLIGLVWLPTHRDYFQPGPQRGPVP